ncbi:hypothetical protein LOZ61_002328 [Ophidiomyces ophidiicola]|nr:hypothetical protein LOZ61_002328 [Ophidiomyces ophidiicola]KAI1915840.1 hypothetical protein LOZ64_003482 [Ophidiomyces ophidiicola]KAI2029725.1 hypothetical protein LOZ48_003505 [Ophidiomyces ophidiicola]KAI2167470.1 hypothetical protein LOZ25_000171 [Ophidiomyces ophidiicola]KAI2202019.1 hypothetical protein LOZ20_001070 [Ophidiomyces ophidiicola]
MSDQKVPPGNSPASDRVEIETVAEGDEKATAKEQKRDYAGAVEKTDPEEIRLVRKLDYRIMPTLFAMYFLNYVDRNTLAQARLNGVEKELGMHGSQFNTAISILFVGYILTQVPRITEAPFYPGATYILSIFYTRKEVATRIAVLYCAQILATGVSGLIAAGVFYGLDNVRGLSGWRWLFIIEGSVTAAIAFMGFWLLPDTPSTTRWLKPEERELAHSRIERDKMGEPEKASMMEGLRQACRDKRTWIFCLMQNLHLSACAFNSFFPTVVKTIGFNTTITLLLTCPPFIFAGAAGILFGYSSGRLHERTWHITVGLLIAIVGFIIAACTLNTAGRYIACFIFPIGAYSVNSVIIGWASSTLSQTREKRAVPASSSDAFCYVRLINH